MKDECECFSWCRPLNPPTIHAPNCPHYNDSLIDVWRVTDGFSSYYTDDEQDALEEFEGDDGLTILKEKMHREIYEKLPEFEGF